MKTKTIYSCQNCGYQSPKWVGRCPDCQKWNTFSEETNIIPTKSSSNISQSRHTRSQAEIVKLTAKPTEQHRLITGFEDFNTVLGGGFKVGSLVLLSGEPGIGKSTLTLQICRDIAKLEDIYYISGEESTEQIASRAARLGITAENINLINENCLENILGLIQNYSPKFLIIDSIQVMYSLDLGSGSGSISQIRYCTERLMEYCKGNNITCLIIGHVNKEGELAGPKVLEHLVDTVLFIEGERHHNFRLVRGLKNRFGTTNEIAIMEMGENGLSEVSNPSLNLLSGRQSNALGSALTITMEGSKPLILEVQALTNTTVFGYPKRTSSGFDLNRLQLLSAVLQKYLKLNLSNQDIFTNVIGGFKLQEPAADLAICMAIISSFKKIPLPEKSIFVGEVGLSGELRPIINLEKRLKEAEKLGFEAVITTLPGKSFKTSGKIKVINIRNLEEAAKLFIS